MIPILFAALAAFPFPPDVANIPSGHCVAWDTDKRAYVDSICYAPVPFAPTEKVYALTYKFCATDKDTAGKAVRTCYWDKAPLNWVYAGITLCDSEGRRELSVNYGPWRTLDHERLEAVDYRCAPLAVLTPKDIPAR